MKLSEIKIGMEVELLRKPRFTDVPVGSIGIVCGVSGIFTNVKFCDKIWTYLPERFRIPMNKKSGWALRKIREIDSRHISNEKKLYQIGAVTVDYFKEKK